MEEGEDLNKGTRGVVEVGGGEKADGMSHLNWKSNLMRGEGRGGDVEGSGRKETEKRKAKKERKTVN